MNTHRSWLAFGIALMCLPGCSDEPQRKPAANRPTATSGSNQPGPDDAGITYTKRSEGRYRESRFMRAHDMFIAADAPENVPADEATFLAEDDEVVGFVVDGEARAYSVRMLSYHHVVNDEIGNTPIAVTY